MRVLHVIRSLDPLCGGPPAVVRSLVREQIRRGHAVTLLATSVQALGPWKPDRQFREETLADPMLRGAEIHILRGFGRRKPWNSLAFAPGAWWWLRRTLADPTHRPDIVHLHGVFSQVFAAAAAEARHRAIPYLIEPYGCLDSGTFGTGHRGLKRAFVRFFLAKDLRHAAAVQVASISEQEELRRWLPSRQVIMIPHGVDPPSADPDEAREAFFTAFPHLRGRRIVLCVARLDPIKRLPLLVGAVAKARRQCAELVLVIAGKDSGGLDALQRTSRELGMTDAVVLVGFLQGQLKEGAFEAADLFALPSRHENFGIVVIEAMAHGVPVVVTPGVASHIHVDKSGGGLTVDDSLDAVTQGIRRLLDADGREMGQRGREYATANLLWSSIVKKLDILYREALAGRAERD